MSNDKGTWDRAKTSDKERATESLEMELRELSDRIAADPLRFQQVADELARRRKVKDEQPPMDVVTVESQRQAGLDLEKNLILKVTAMESQQAQLVVEAEIAKAAQREAEERLALVVKRLPAKRESMTRDAARSIVLCCLNAWTAKRRVEVNSTAELEEVEETLRLEPPEWVIDAVIEASR